MSQAFPKHLNIATLPKPAERGPIANKTGSTDFETKFVNLFSKFLNFTFTTFIPKDRAIGQPSKDGNWTGMMGQMQRGECDMSFFMSGLTDERSAVVDYTYPFDISRLTFMTQKPQPLRKDLAIFYPFSSPLWATLIVFIIGFSFVFSAILPRKKQYVRTFISTIGNVFGQSFSVRFTSPRQMFVFSCWIIAIPFVIHCYRATLLSFLMVVPVRGISTIAELASAVDDGSVRCRTYPGSFIIKALLASSDESFRIIGRSVYENSREYEDIIDYLANNTGAKAFIGTVNTFANLQHEHFISKETFFPIMFGFPIRKNFCCKRVIDNMVRRMVEAGLFDKIFRDRSITLFIGREKLKQAFEAEHKITIEDMRGAIVIMICGHILAFLVFIAEIAFPKISKRSQY